MTEHVRTSYRRHRKATGALVLVALAAVGLAIVIPALGAPGDIPPPAEPSDLTPTSVNVGGSNFSCSTHAGNTPAGLLQFQVPNPPSSATTVTYDSSNASLPAGVTFKLTGLNGADKGKFFGFSVTGARVFHIGVKGGSNSAWYNYYAKFPLGVTADGIVAPATLPTNTTGLHATKKDANSFYVASYTTFCFKPVVKIEGFVYRDTNGDGSTDGDSALTNPSHQVTLSTGASTTTDGSGKYSFLVPTGSSFTVCATAATGEVQTKPSDGKNDTNACTNADGYSFTNVTSDQTTGNDFAFSGGVTASCAQNGGSVLHSQFNAADANATVDAKLYSTGTSCKANSQQFVFTTYTTNSGSTRVAKLAAVNPLGGNCVLATGANCVIYAERITWSFTATDVPDLKQLSYDDTAEGGTHGVMRFCEKDPFDRSASDGVTLRTGTGYLPTDILPAVNGVYESSCLARTTQYSPPNAPNDAERVDEAYSAYDSGKNLG